MASNNSDSGSTNGGTNVPRTIMVRPDGASNPQEGNQPGATVRIMAAGTSGASSTTTSTPIQVLTPEMLASLAAQGFIVQKDADNRPVLQAVKRTLSGGTSTSEQTIKKVVISRNPGTKTLVSAANSGGTITRVTADGKKILGSGSPIKVITVSQGSTLPKGVVIGTSPSKQNMLGQATRIALPAKSPGKTITLAGPTTPKKIAPASAPGPQTILVKGSVGSTPGTITLSSGAVAKVINVINTTGASSTGVGSGQVVPVQIHASNQPHAQQLTSGMTTIRPAGNNMAATSGNVQAVNMAGTSNMQAVNMAGKTFPYVRLVTVSTNTTTTATQAKPILQMANAKPIAPAPSAVGTLTTSSAAGAPRTINIPIAPAQNVNKISGQIGGGNQPRFIMPANAQVKIINAGKMAPGTTLFPAGGNLLQSYAVIPAHYLNQQVTSQSQPLPQWPAHHNPVAMPETQPVTSQSQPAAVASSSQSSSSASQGPPQQTQSVKHTSSNGMLAADPSGNRPRKPCNCTKSQCLKLYCDCFANGEFCRNCNCNNCLNNLEHEDERTKAVKSCLDRNPHAFHPKIGKGQGGQQDRRHNKGCNCKRSGCLKNYCECYEAKILCSSSCKCVGCKNFEESPERKTLMHLADAAEVRVQQQTAARTKLSTQLQDYPTKTREFSDSGERLPFSFITKEVAEATLQCLMAQADECERSNHPVSYAEYLILEEFGRCINQVIHSAGKTKGLNAD